MKTVLDESLARKVLEIVDMGLCQGLGSPVPGMMCVEAAVCYALGEPHNDNPSCVGNAVRSYKIRLNDANWPSNTARAEGMREIAIAQLGSNEIDQKAFAIGVIVKGIQRILPIALRAAAELIPTHKAALEAAAIGCEAVIDLLTGKAASIVARKAAAAAHAAADAAAHAAAHAAAAADAYAAAAAAAYVAAHAAAAAAAYADAAAAAAAYAAAHAAAAADAYAAAAAAAYVAAYAAAYADAARIKILKMAADIGVEVLKELKCKGTQWLFLCDKS